MRSDDNYMVSQHPRVTLAVENDFSSPLKIRQFKNKTIYHVDVRTDNIRLSDIHIFSVCECKHYWEEYWSGKSARTFN